MRKLIPISFIFIISCINKSPELFEGIKLGMDWEEFETKIDASNNISRVNDQYGTRYKYDMGEQFYEFETRTTNEKISYISGSIESKKTHTPGVAFKNKIINVLSKNYGAADTFSYSYTAQDNLSNSIYDSITLQKKVYLWKKSTYEVEFSFFFNDNWAEKPNGMIVYKLNSNASKRLKEDEKSADRKKIDL